MIPGAADGLAGWYGNPRTWNREAVAVDEDEDADDGLAKGLMLTGAGFLAAGGLIGTGAGAANDALAGGEAAAGVVDDAVGVGDGGFGAVAVAAGVVSDFPGFGFLVGLLGTTVLLGVGGGVFGPGEDGDGGRDSGAAAGFLNFFAGGGIGIRARPGFVFKGSGIATGMQNQDVFFISSKLLASLTGSSSVCVYSDCVCGIVLGFR